MVIKIQSIRQNFFFIFVLKIAHDSVILCTRYYCLGEMRRIFLGPQYCFQPLHLHLNWKIYFDFSSNHGLDSFSFISFHFRKKKKSQQVLSGESTREMEGLEIKIFVNKKTEDHQDEFNDRKI